jgi:hypothetical protein
MGKHTSTCVLLAVIALLAAIVCARPGAEIQNLPRVVREVTNVQNLLTFGAPDDIGGLTFKQVF